MIIVIIIITQLMCNVGFAHQNRIGPSIAQDPCCREITLILNRPYRDMCYIIHDIHFGYSFCGETLLLPRRLKGIPKTCYQRRFRPQSVNSAEWEYVI